MYKPGVVVPVCTTLRFPFGGRGTQEADAFFAFCTAVRSPASLRQIDLAAILQCN